MMKDWLVIFFIPILTAICLLIMLYIFSKCKCVVNISVIPEGTYITILSVLVTILIGWNIYSALDINRRVENIEHENASIKDSTEKALLDVQIRAKSAIDSCQARIDSSEEYNMGCVDFVQALVFYNDVNDHRHMLKYKLFTSSLLHYLRSDNQIHNQISACLDNIENCLILKEKDSKFTGTELDYVGIDDAFAEIISSPSKEFDAEQRNRYVLIENKRKHKKGI